MSPAPAAFSLLSSLSTCPSRHLSPDSHSPPTPTTQKGDSTSPQAPAPGRQAWWDSCTPAAQRNGALWAGGGGVEQGPASLGQAADVVPGREQLRAAMSSLDAVASGSLTCLHSKVCLLSPLEQVEEPLPQSTTEAFQHLTSPTDLKITSFLSPPNKLLKKNHRASVFTRLTAGSICHRSLSLNQYFPSLCSQAEFLPCVNFRSSGHPSGLRGPGVRAISLLMIFWWG